MLYKTKNLGSNMEQLPVGTESGGIDEAIAVVSGPDEERLFLFIWQWMMRLGLLVGPMMGIFCQPRRTVPPCSQLFQLLGGNPS